jgi:cell wall-associated NlpC family hydrolase
LKTINRFIVILILAVSFQFCNFNSEPEKVWGLRLKIVKLAESLKGIRYRYGGSEIYGFDCSGFVKYVYGSFGIDIPRTAKKQGKIKHKAKFDKAKPGDILIFKISRKKWHSGIYVNKIYFLHSPNGRGYVRREKYGGYWMKKLKSVISIIDRY